MGVGIFTRESTVVVWYGKLDDVNDSVVIGMEREDRVRKHGYGTVKQGQVQGHPLVWFKSTHQSWSGKTAAFAPAVIS